MRKSDCLGPTTLGGQTRLCSQGRCNFDFTWMAVAWKPTVNTARRRSVSLPLHRAHDWGRTRQTSFRTGSYLTTACRVPAPSRTPLACKGLFCPFPAGCVS
jgi:hypothetical protein